MGGVRALCGVFALLVVLAAPVTAHAATAVPKATCRAGDRPETGLQGQVPWPDRVSGRAALGYSCNLRETGGVGAVDEDPAQQRLSAWSNFDTYDHCAYYGDGNEGTVVVDVSDPAKPVQTAHLEGGAMAGPWESLRVNARRGLLVADYMPPIRTIVDSPQSPSPFDVYDVSGDCAHPRKLFSGVLPNATGHEGWFQPDGLVYYASNFSGKVVPIDLSDPRHPRELAVWGINAHGGSISDDGTRGYFCVDTAATQVVVVDTSEVQARRPNARFREIARIALPDTLACQETYPVTYRGHPYLIQFGELGETAGVLCPSQAATFSRPHVIDMADERHPRVVATLMNEVALPEHCAQVAADHSTTTNPNGNQPYSIFVYGTHMCHPDRLHDPTILACAEWLSGVRVYDIRNPLKAREIAYFNSGTLSATDTTVDMAAARPVIRPDRGEIWYASVFGGFHVLKFARGVYPSAAALACPRRPDWFVEQYNPPTAERCGSRTPARPRAARPGGAWTRVLAGSGRAPLAACRLAARGAGGFGSLR